jgi:hypothetical protein
MDAPRVIDPNETAPETRRNGSQSNPPSSPENPQTVALN